VLLSVISSLQTNRNTAAIYHTILSTMTDPTTTDAITSTMEKLEVMTKQSTILSSLTNRNAADDYHTMSSVTADHTTTDGIPSTMEELKLMMVELKKMAGKQEQQEKLKDEMAANREELNQLTKELEKERQARLAKEEAVMLEGQELSEKLEEMMANEEARKELEKARNKAMEGVVEILQKRMELWFKNPSPPEE